MKISVSAALPQHQQQLRTPRGAGDTQPRTLHREQLLLAAWMVNLGLVRAGGSAAAAGTALLVGILGQHVIPVPAH